MTPLNCPSRSFQEVYLRRTTGGYYTRDRRPMRPDKPDHALITGKPSCMLVPVFRLFRVDPEKLTTHEEVFSFPRDDSRLRLSVGQEELDLYFDRLPQCRAVQRSDLDDLLSEYKREGMRSKPQSLAKVAHRYAATMEDSQARCLLELMARVLDEHFSKEIGQDTLASNEPDVVK